MIICMQPTQMYGKLLCTENNFLVLRFHHETVIVEQCTPQIYIKQAITSSKLNTKFCGSQFVWHELNKGGNESWSCGSSLCYGLLPLLLCKFCFNVSSTLR